ncbi:MAG: glycosyltransferase [Thermoanaerobaculia bacterium]
MTTTMRHLLLLSNGFYPDRSTGTPYWCSLVAEKLAGSDRVTVLACSDDAPVAPSMPVERMIGTQRVLMWRERPGTYDDPVRQFFRPELDAALDAIVDRERPDAALALNFAGFSSTIAAAFVRRGIPLFYYVNDVAPFCCEGYFSRPEQTPCIDSNDGASCVRCLQRHSRDAAIAAALRNWSRCLARSFAGVAAPTRWFADRLCAEVGEERGSARYRVIRYGLPPRAPVSRRASRNPQVFAVYGGGEARKGGAVLLESCDRIVARRGVLPFSLRWYGGQPPQERAYVDQRGAVSPDALMAAMESEIDVSLFPSFGEVFPLTMLQSLQASVPVITTALGGYEEMLTDGHDSVFVPAGDARALADALERVAGGSLHLTADRTKVRSVDKAAGELRAMLAEPVLPTVSANDLEEARDAVCGLL